MAPGSEAGVDATRRRAPAAGRPGAGASGWGMAARIAVEVEQALGPGVEFEPTDGGGIVGRCSRTGAGWTGFDRASATDTDDGRGRRLAVLVALPVSTFSGARLEVELTGGWQTPEGPILVGRLIGDQDPDPGRARIAAGIVGEASWLDRTTAADAARAARRRFRERRSRARIVGGRAWQPGGSRPPELARWTTPHSRAEYRLGRLPPRYLRALAGLLDDDERVLYWVERPVLPEVGIVRRIRDRPDRRAALLALTDRQLLWLVDHTAPDRFLSDWGVDVALVPIERVLEADCGRRGSAIELSITTAAGASAYVVPEELLPEVGVLRDLIGRFTPGGAGLVPRRRYPLEAIPFDEGPAARFGQAPEARTLRQATASGDELLASLFSPRRPGRRQPALISLGRDSVWLASGNGERPPDALDLAAVRAIELTLSPLVGRLSFGSGIALDYPAPFAAQGAALARLARRALANVV
jgi:hypothetical protein